MKITREEMMHTAIALFQRDGYEQVTVEQICQACDVTKGSFYHHFKTKDDVLLSFYDSVPENMQAVAGKLIQNSSPKEQLWSLLEINIDRTIALGPDLLKHLIILDMRQGAKVLTPYRQNTSNYQGTWPLMTGAVAKAQEQGEIYAQASPDDLLFAYISALLGVAMDWSAGGGTYDEKKELRRLFEIIFHQ